MKSHGKCCENRRNYSNFHCKFARVKIAISSHINRKPTRLLENLVFQGHFLKLEYQQNIENLAHQIPHVTFSMNATKQRSEKQQQQQQKKQRLIFGSQIIVM